MFDVARHTIFLAVAGSHAHGTAREGSDVDLRGVCIAPLSARLSLFESFEQHDGPLDGDLLTAAISRMKEHPTASQGLENKTESVIFDVSKFLRLCAAANPNALEILFTDEQDWLYETDSWRRLHGARHLFLTREVQQTFSGYAMSQLKRIRNHRGWLLDPPSRKPSRKEFGLPADVATLSRDDQNRIELAIAEKIRSYGIDDIDMPKGVRIAVQERLEELWIDLLAVPEEEVEARLRAVATHALELPAEVVAALNAEKRYRAAMKHWSAYQAWKAQRNPARGELEKRHGYDTKHAMHLIRLMRMGLEALETGDLRVRRPDAGELNAIRDGALSYEELIAAAEELQGKMRDSARRSRLPKEVDRDQADALLVDLIRLEESSKLETRGREA